MAQCEAERRKYPTMDVYAGIFNSKLYASSRGSTRGGAGSRHSFDAPSADVENVPEDAVPAERSSFQSRRFRNGYNKPPALSDYRGSNRKPASVTNVGCMKDEMRSSLTDVVNGGYGKKSAASDPYSTTKLSSSQNDVLHGVDWPHTDTHYVAGHVGNEMKGLVSNVGHGLSNKNVAQTNLTFSSGGNNSLVADVGSATTAPSFMSSANYNPHAGIHDCNTMKESSKEVVCQVSDKNEALHGTKLKSNSHANRSRRNGESGTKMGSDTGLESGSGAVSQQSDVTANREHFRGSRTSRSIALDDDSAGSRSMRVQKSTQVVTCMAHVTTNGTDQEHGGLSQDNGYARKSQEFSVTTGSSLLCGAGYTKADQAQEHSVGRRAVSSSNELLCFERNFTKTGTYKEIENTTSELVLKDSPSRVHNLVANLRVGGSVSTDSSSSHGGSSHSGSPTAADNSRDSRVSSFGNILLSKGSPHSISSRSMGSLSISGSGSLAPAKSSFSDSPGTQFRYGTSSGRKSAELVPNRRYSEVVPNRKSSEMMSRSHIRGTAMQGHEENGIFSSGNSGRGTPNIFNGNSGRGTPNIFNGTNISAVGNGNLLVGSTNGNVLSVGGVGKLNSRQGDVVNHSNMVDCTLLKKAQTSSDPEEMKNAGNEYYRRGHFSEALILYTKAVGLRPSNAAYKSNRAAALSALGRMGEAVKECEEAIRLDSGYCRAHQRVAALYLRLGLMERAKKHLYAAGQQSDVLEMQRLRNIDEHVSRCIEARRRGEWLNVIRESDAAVVAGADSAPQIFGFKSEALLGLHRPDEADVVCTAAQRVESSLVKAGILPADPFLLMIRAQVDMALGRFEGALEAAKSAAKIDPCSENVSALLRKAQTVCHTRTTGNELFKGGRFFEALAMYAEGLESDPRNAVLLCNRAACRSKLGQWEKAIEDCDAALRVQPNYTKALMRRANCLTKLERWEDALQDYEILRRKVPEDLEVARGLFDVHVAMKRLQGEDTSKMKFGGDVEEVRSDEQFQEAITSPGLSVVQFVTKWSERCRQLAPFIDSLCKRNPCVNFLRVDVEDNPDLAKFESVSFIPTFKIYKSGQKVKDIVGPTEQSLEYALRHYTL